MEKTGIVTKADETTATIRIHRDSACGENCKACGLCEGGRELEVTVKNTAALQAGDTVRLTMNDNKFIARSAAAYLSLTLLLIAGAVAGNIVGGELCSFFGAFLFLFAGIFALKRIMSREMDIKTEKI